MLREALVGVVVAFVGGSGDEVVSGGDVVSGGQVESLP